MVTIGITTPDQAVYARVSLFARQLYAHQLGAAISADPDAFAYASANKAMIGCFGIYLAASRQPLLIERYVDTVFGKISGELSPNRNTCAEIGTRAIMRVAELRGPDLSLALSARLLIYAHSCGIRYVGFTSNRTVQALASELGIKLLELGVPDSTCMGACFTENWRTFFRTPQRCYGFQLTSILGCQQALERLRVRGILST